MHKVSDDNWQFKKYCGQREKNTKAGKLLTRVFSTLVSDGSLMKHYRRLRNAISKTKIKSQSLDILRLGLEF